MFRVGDEFIRLEDNERFIIIYVDTLFLWVMPHNFSNLFIIKPSNFSDLYSLTGRSVDLQAIVLSELGNYNITTGDDKNE